MNRIEHDATSGQVRYVPIDDAWKLANWPDRLAIEADKLQIVANGEDAATISVQWLNPLGQAKGGADSVTLLVDDEEVPVTLVNGAGTVQVVAVEAGTFQVKAAEMGSLTLEIEAVSNAT